MVVVKAAEAAEQFPGRSVRLADAILVLEHEDVGRVADEDLVARPDRVLGDGDAERGKEVWRLIEGQCLISFAHGLGVFKDDDAVPGRPVGRPPVQPMAIVHRLANPDSALVVDVHAGRIDEQRLGGPERDFQSVGHPERAHGLLGWHLGADG
jgi:hypothetical protein